METSVHEIIKKCSICKVDLPLSNFYLDNRSKDKKGRECKTCVKRKVDLWTKENYDKKLETIKNWNRQDLNKEKRRLYRLKWQRENRGKMSEIRRNWVLNNPTKEKNRRLVYSTGITLEQYEEMLKNQNGVCCICNHISEDGRQLCVDHCHNTGKIRGLLCNKCNAGIGFFKDRIDVLSSAINYLQKNGS